MKKTIFSLVFLGFFLLSFASEPIKINVMTFNIRLDAPIDSLNNWRYRKDVAAQIIKDYDVDIVGTQEVFQNQKEDLENRLPQYVAIGVGREDGANKGEHSAIFYRKDRFIMHDSGTFWLSETPDIPSMGWDAAYPRVATWAVLEEIKTKKRFFVINTHLDHIGKEARIKGVTLMLQKALDVANGLPVILTGDFNSSPNSDVVQYITNPEVPNSLINSSSIAKIKKDRNRTFHDFGRNEEGEYIDYIFVSKEIDVQLYEVLQDKLDGIYLSDHTPVFIELTIK